MWILNCFCLVCTLLFCFCLVSFWYLFETNSSKLFLTSYFKFKFCNFYSYWILKKIRKITVYERVVNNELTYILFGYDSWKVVILMNFNFTRISFLQQFKLYLLVNYQITQFFVNNFRQACSAGMFGKYVRQKLMLRHHQFEVCRSIEKLRNLSFNSTRLDVKVKGVEWLISFQKVLNPDNS